MKDKPKVGQILYSLNVGNATRGCEQVLTESVVKKVGRKYFTCGVERKTWRDTVYHLSDWREKTEYGARSVLYESKQEWEDEKGAGQICAEIGAAFKWGRNHKGLGLDALRGLKRILDANAKAKEVRG
jgi:hypothetical protein